MARRDWTREELIVAFNLYCRIPFGRIHIRNPEIIRLATALQRSPSSVSWKLANFARLDPALQARRIRGASHGSKAEEEVWNAFHANWDALAFESERLLAAFENLPLEDLGTSGQFPEGKTREATVKIRVNQGFFRSAVLAAYESTCCITGIRIPELLIASHIVPWALDEKNRTNPRNGLCLNAVHDRAFDGGLMTIGSDYRIRISKQLKKLTNQADQLQYGLLLQWDGTRITLPERFQPDPTFLEYHSRTRFKDSMS